MSRKTLAAAGLAAALLSTAASATPIEFDFSGVVQRQSIYDHGTITDDFSMAGQAFTARYVLDTALLTQSQTSCIPGGCQQWNGSPLLASPPEFSLQVNGAPFTIPIYEQNMDSVTAQDGALPPGCTVCGVSDSVMMMYRSQQAAPAVGQQLASTFAFIAYEVSPNGDSPSYIDLSVPFDVESLLTMPLPNLSLQFGTTIFDCEAVNLCFANHTETTWFTTTSVTRTVLSQDPHGVPEPGTLGLLAASLLGGFLIVGRRRGTGVSRGR